MSCSALAPKLIRRAKGDVGDCVGGASPSSMAHSSIDELGESLLPELVFRFLE